MTPDREELEKSQLSVAHKNYEKLLISHAFFKTKNKAASEDLVQSAFIKTWAYISRGGTVKCMKAFLYHVLDQLIIDEYRKRTTVSLDTLMERGLESDIASPAVATEISEEKLALTLIANLPEKYRKIMKMRYVKDFSIKEISKISGQSENNISVQLHRGHCKLKSLIEEKNKIIEN